ncbi:MAG: PD-(D/E)XK nuclease family protein [Gammaproteobacteria bacterium]|nr:PD-(D/E)XK nuclease family protein [Gammaproteobacteria bacterium]
MGMGASSDVSGGMWRTSIEAALLSVSAPILVEGALWSAEHGYAGTGDLIAIMDTGELEAVDWKTSDHNPYPEAWAGDYKLQLAAYAHAAEEMYGVTIQGGRIVVLHPHAPPTTIRLTRSDLEMAFTRFKVRLANYRPRGS